MGAINAFLTDYYSQPFVARSGQTVYQAGEWIYEFYIANVFKWQEPEAD